MRCEVCGDEIRGQPHRKVIEGGRLTVCGRCAGFGSGEWSPTRPTQRMRGSPPPPRRPRSEVEATEGLELIEDYGATIRKARQKMRFNIEDFSRMIKEKESVVKKLEKEDLNPDRKLIRKLENALDVKLLEASTSTAVPVSRRG
jgi:putative transcription factor